jgi:hypothetical protein
MATWMPSARHPHDKCTENVTTRHLSLVTCNPVTISSSVGLISYLLHDLFSLIPPDSIRFRFLLYDMVDLP